MPSSPRLTSVEPAQDPSGLGNGEVRGRKRKRAGTPIAGATLSGVAAAKLPSTMRISFMSRLHQRRRMSPGLKGLWAAILDVFEEARPDDISFALLYSIHDDGAEGPKPQTVPVHGSETLVLPKQLVLEGAVGLDDANSNVSLLWPLLPRELCRESQVAAPTLMAIDPISSLHRAMQLIGHDLKPPADGLVLCPILAHDAHIIAFILLGVKSESYDEEFQMFAQLLTDSVGESVSVLLLREKLKDVVVASEMLLRRAEEAERSDFMFRHMAELATVGCAIFDPSGRPMWLNEAYLNLTGIPREGFRPGVWQKAIVPDDLPTVEGSWKKLAAGEPIVPFTFRVKRHLNPAAKPGSCESLEYRWLLSNAYVDFNEDGSCRRVMGWLTDISAQKWNEHLQTQRLADALETKRQTEKFIDMVSHEIRNPLSAIIQTADGVRISMDRQKQDKIPLDIRETIMDAGETIILCAHHQKRIVDDILTLSKLDSNLLVISPNKVQPRDLIQKAMKMSEAELLGAQIEASISIDDSYEALSIDSVLLDESRVLQILLNLITNAIKFTRNQKERRIRIRLSALQNRPSIETPDISYIAPRLSQVANLNSSDSGQGGSVYLIFAVDDTGPGLSKDDMKSLFQRFSQASPKTYRGYGGFGLGLFICRELAELQGGQIGLSSVLGQGTTLTFYVHAQRYRSESFKPQGADKLESSHIGNHSLTLNPSTVGDAIPRAPSTQLSPAAAAAAAATAIETSAATLDPKKLHVLVVEDNKINQTVLVRQLKFLGCSVHTADHGVEALELLSRSNLYISKARDHGLREATIEISVVLMDLEMPIMDGLTCVRRIRQMEAEGVVQHVPVIAVTANARSDQIAGAIEAGMDSVVTKPFRIPELIPKIAAVIKEG